MEPPEQSPAAGNGMETLEGTIERIVFESQESGFFVARFLPTGCVERVTIVGNALAVSEGETVRVEGQWGVDPRFGKQFRVERYSVVLPTSIAGIEKYLSSGLVAGVGPVYAKRIVAAFGIETLRVIDEQPQRLREIAGIGRKRAQQIIASWQSQKAVQAIMLFLQGHGIGIGQAIRIYRRYGDRAVAVLRENPYRLADDIVGIAFKSADVIAQQLGMALDAPQRAEAGLVYVLQQARAEGHVFLPDGVLLERATALLNVQRPIVEAGLDALGLRGGAHREESAAFLPPLYLAEIRSAERLKRLRAAPARSVTIDAERAIQWIEKTQGLALSPEQGEAVRRAVTEKVLIITGGPGTGKTTVLNGILAVFAMKRLTCALTAPTGRAARRMEAATGREAKTIHRLLEFSPKNGRFLRDGTNPLDADLVVVDETSMVDIQLMQALTEALSPAARLILVGDVDQLPSVGPGNVLMDCIASGVIPVVRLATVYRQAGESGIVTNAHRINRGEGPLWNEQDFFFVERKDPVAARDTVIELVARRIPAKFGLDPMRDIQVLAPMHRGEAGVAMLNEQLQAALNPNGCPVPRRSFRVGDKVMQMRNNYELDVSNGDSGLVRSVDEEAQELQVDFEDRSVLYSFENAEELALAYAATVHKAQGSEYPAVVMPLLPQHYLLLQRNMLYTAVTRARQVVVMVGDPKSLRMAIRNVDVVQRNTRLASRLRNEL